MLNIPHRYDSNGSKAEGVSLLLLRLILAYGFLNPALLKIKDISSIAEWFASLHIPFPVLSAYLTAGIEMLGTILLASGLFVRIISVPLILIMIVAIASVHWDNGFEAGNNGFEIPLYYIVMLCALLVFGAGRFSADRLLFKVSSRDGKKQNSATPMEA